MASTPVPNDALGGGGSIKSDLRSIAVNGLSKAIDGYFAKKYALTSLNDTATVNASGDTRPASAPQNPTSAAAQFAGVLTNPITVAIGVAAALAVVVALVLRR